MALRWVEGFDQYGDTPTASAVGLQARYPVATISSPTVRAGRLFGSSVSNAHGTTNTKIMTPNLGNMATVIVGGAFYFDNDFSDRLIVLWEDDGSTEGFNLRLTSSGTLQAYRGNSLLDTSGVVISEDTWYYIEMKVRVGNAGVGNYEIRVNGVNVLSDNDADTQAGATNAYANRVEFYIRINNNTFIDDVYVADTVVNNDEPIDFVGDCRVETLYPTADGANADFTPSTGMDNYAMVDDQGFDDDSTYVESSTAGHIDDYEFTNLTTAEEIIGLQFTVIARKTDVTDYDIELRLNGNNSSPVTVNSTSYAGFTQIFGEDPDTSMPWIDDDINASEFGYEVG